MKSYKSNLDIYPEKLKAEIKKRGLDMKEVSVEIGRSFNYLSSCCHAGDINQQSVLLLDKLFNIPKETYLKIESEEQASPNLFNADDIVEELKILRGVCVGLSEVVDGLSYTLNVIAKDLKLIKGELMPTESEGNNVD